MIIDGEKAVYHVMSRTALDGFPLKNVEKDFLLEAIKRFSSLYSTKILGFCLMGNHFHLLLKMIPEDRFTDEEIQKRVEIFYEDSRIFSKGQLPYFREKLSSLSEFVREIKVDFARYYNRRHNRRGYFWGTGSKASLSIKVKRWLTVCRILI
jgi:REP element-mobilizing transposase RayT